MTEKLRVAILFPANNQQPHETNLDQSRHAETAHALAAAGLDVIGAPYADSIVDDVRARLLRVDGVLVWYNPNEGGCDRSVLNAMLRNVASQGIFVSTHPDIIDKIGTKEVLYRTRKIGWGCDTRFYATLDAVREGLPASLASGSPRVLKQIRGQSGDGVWKVMLAEAGQHPAPVAMSKTLLRIRHAKRGSPEVIMSMEDFLAQCRDYLKGEGAMIDQEYQPRLPEGMVRCYLVGDRVAGFGEQLVNMLYPAAAGAPVSEAPLPGPRLYYPPTRADFQRLKDKLEHEWLDEMCRIVGIDKLQLPALWDADFLYGPRDADGADTYVLCEINVSSVHPFPPDALQPLAAHALARLSTRR